MFRGCGGSLWLGCGRAELTASDQSRDSGHSRESGAETSEPETVYDCIKSDLQVMMRYEDTELRGVCRSGHRSRPSPRRSGEITPV